jgi:hypothetical protein
MSTTTSQLLAATKTFADDDWLLDANPALHLTYCVKQSASNARLGRGEQKTRRQGAGNTRHGAYSFNMDIFGFRVVVLFRSEHRGYN